MCLAGGALSARAQNDLQDQGGPVMQSPKVYLIFWLGTDPNAHFDPSGAAGDATYESVIRRFFTDVSASTYLNIMSQYPGVCEPPSLTTTQPCFGTVTVAGSTVDTTTVYPEAGDPAHPLQDSDIRTEVTNFIAANSVTPGLDTEFFVFTAANINECIPGDGCTSTDFCAYHDSFQSGGNTVIYAFLPNDNSLSGCDETVTASPNLVSADREIIAASHEFSESITDPRPMDSSDWREIDTGSEIGDICVPWVSPTGLGTIASDRSNVHLNGNPYLVQEEWSNDDEACVLSFSSAITGPSLEYTVGTGSDDLRSDSSATSDMEGTNGVTFQTVTLKTESQPTWDHHAARIRVFEINQPQAAPLGNVDVTLTTHNHGTENDDNWNIQNADLKVRNPNGTVFCDTPVSGNPAARLSTQAPTATFATPTCAPAPPPTAFVSVVITIGTGNDNARSDTELWATFNGEPAICLKPSNNADPDGTCNNGGSATDQNGHQDWNITSSTQIFTSTQTFTLATPQTLDGGTLTIQLIEHDSPPEGDDNWDIQSITVTGVDSMGNSTLLLSMSVPLAGDNCMARLGSGSPHPSRVTYNLSVANPATSNLANPTFGPTPPGSCPQ
jgi:hypothetical protein